MTESSFCLFSIMNTTDKNQNDHNPMSMVTDITQRLWDAKVVIMMGLAAVLFRGCYYSQKIVEPSQIVTASNSVYATTGNLIGKTVTIRSKPIQKIGSSSFTIEDKRFLGGKPIVAINASGTPFDLPNDPDTQVQVTGQVRKLVPSEIEREFHLRLQDKYYKNYTNRPAIIARSIAIAPEVEQITQNPSQFYGKKLAVMGKVENIETPVLFTVDQNHFSNTKELLVLLKTPPKKAITQDQTIALTGVIQPFVADNLARDYKLNWDSGMKKQMEATYGHTPVLIAEVVAH
jgi:hypothetical protein